MDDGKLSFANSLWKSFDQVYDRVTRGRHDLKALHKLLADLAAIEETYAKSVEKLAKQKEFEAEGSLSKCWADMKETLTQTGSQHQQLAQMLLKDVGASVDDNVKDLKVQKTDLQKKYKAAKEDLAKKQSIHDKSRKRYQSAVKDAETAILNRDTAQREGHNEQALAKLRSKMESSLKELDSSHEAYKDAVNNLRAAQEKYDVDIRQWLEQFEALERERITRTQEQFRRIAQGFDILKAGLTTIQTSLTRAADDVNVEQDVISFIQTHEAKEQPPAHIEYEQIVSEIVNHARGIAPSASNASSIANKPAEKKPVAVAAAAAPVVKDEKKAAPAAAPGPATAPAPKASSMNKGPPAEYVQALYDFQTQEPDDLPFKTGDIIKLVDRSDDDWWKGELNGRVGTFPSNYVKTGVSNDAAEPAEQAKAVQGKCEALYNFEGQGSDELSFKQGDILEVTGELNGWYLGKTRDGRMGIFPSNYVVML